MNRLSLILLFGLLLAGCQITNNSIKAVKINDQILTIEVASTESKKIRGLSGRENLPADSGILFIYPNYDIRQIWMKEMRFPIDIIWIKDNQVVGLGENLPIPTSTELLIYPSPEPINYIIETNAGWTKDKKIKIGDGVDFIY